MAKDYSKIVSLNELTIITKKDLAKMMCLSPSTIYRMVKAHQLPPPLKTPCGHTRGWSVKTLKEWAETK